MFSTNSSNRKPLLRTNSERPTMRNWPLFIFLFCLVFFFYAVYVYQAQSTELSYCRDQVDSLALQLKQVKDELVDAKAELERSKSSAASLTKEKTDLTAKNEECSTNLRSNTLKLESLQVEKQALESTKQNFEKENTDLKGNLTEFERNATSLKQLIDSQKAVIDQQNQTMKLMQSELDTQKGQKGNVQATTAPEKKPEDEKKPDEKKDESKTPEEQKSDQDKEKKVEKKETDLGPEQLVDLPVKEEEAKNEENKDAAKDPAKEQAVVAQPPVDNANGEPVQQAQNQQAINDAIIGNQNDGAGDGVQDANANGEKLQNGPVHVQPVPPLNNQDNKKVVGGDYAIYLLGILTVLIYLFAKYVYELNQRKRVERGHGKSPILGQLKVNMNSDTETSCESSPNSSKSPKTRIHNDSHYECILSIDYPVCNGIKELVV